MAREYKRKSAWRKGLWGEVQRKRSVSFKSHLPVELGFPSGSAVKNPPAMKELQEMQA